MTVTEIDDPGAADHVNKLIAVNIGEAAAGGAFGVDGADTEGVHGWMAAEQLGLTGDDFLCAGKECARARYIGVQSSSP